MTIWLGQAVAEGDIQHIRWDRNKLSAELREGKDRQEFTKTLEAEIAKIQPNIDLCEQDPTPDRHNQLVFYALREAGKKHFTVEPTPPEWKRRTTLTRRKLLSQMWQAKQANGKAVTAKTKDRVKACGQRLASFRKGQIEYVNETLDDDIRCHLGRRTNA